MTDTAKVAPPHSDQATEMASSKKEQRRVLISSFLGSTVEYYDFLLYGAAAGLVFPYLFFHESMDPVVGMLLSYVILFTGYVARPIGGLLFGHLGDRVGRKNILFVTLMVMGVVSAAIGLMPTYHQIGIWAPILLVVLRVVQGVAVGGEWAGAMLMATEHSNKDRRGFAASVAVAGGPAGSVLSTLVLALFAGLPEEDFMSWGWRVPFLLSVVLVVIGLYMRARLNESPEFEAAKRAGEAHTGVPLKRLFTVYPKETLFSTLAIMAPLFMQALMAIFAVPFVVENGVVDRQQALIMLTFSAFLHVFAIPFFASLSDRFGRLPVMLTGAAIGILLVFPMFTAFGSSSLWLIALGFIIGNPIIQASIYGPVGAFLAEKFDTQDRYTGVSFTYQMGSVLGAGIAPMLSTWLVDRADGAPTYVAFYFIAITIVSAISIILAEKAQRERKQKTATIVVETAPR